MEISLEEKKAIEDMNRFANGIDMSCVTARQMQIILNLVEKLKKENKELKDNWNKLREWLKEYEEGSHGLGAYETGLSDGLRDVIKKMQELEQGGITY